MENRNGEMKKENLVSEYFSILTFTFFYRVFSDFSLKKEKKKGKENGRENSRRKNEDCLPMNSPIAFRFFPPRKR